MVERHRWHPVPLCSLAWPWPGCRFATHPAAIKTITKNHSFYGRNIRGKRFLSLEYGCPYGFSYGFSSGFSIAVSDSHSHGTATRANFSRSMRCIVPHWCRRCPGRLPWSSSKFANERCCRDIAVLSCWGCWVNLGEVGSYKTILSPSFIFVGCFFFLTGNMKQLKS